jgi:hypothetical protein
MLRGRLIVEELIAANIINEDQPLLVVGAGAGGVTAAMFAAENNIHTTLVEKEPKAFSVQRRSSRQIHPVQYDWPVNHYIEGNAFWNGLRMPLPFTVNESQQLTTNWNLILRDFANTNAIFRLMFNTEITEINVIEIRNIICDKPKSLRVTFDNNAHSDNFSAVIWATGAGAEDCQFRLDGVPRYEGIRFWHYDQFESERCGLPDDNPSPKIVISGSGDGALQDFLRCVTRQSLALTIYNILFSSIDLGIQQQIKATIHSAEDRASRCLIWASTRQQEDAIYQELENEHISAITYLLTIGTINYNLQQLLSEWLQEYAEISLIFRRNYFKNYYPLNRFLVLLIAQYLENCTNGNVLYRNRNVLYRNSEIVDIQPSNGHECMIEDSQGTGLTNGNPACYGQEHTVKLTNNTELTANIIIIRHGLNSDPSSPILKPNKDRCLEIIRKKHLMPYHWPQC